ncbi:MAG: toxin-antitoxin system HicB family antitoxin [Candidatus Cloacimonas sp.]|nr:toxin-antitoxin system HicB family antitoxin [Candidatus Cloacimonas sp.]NLX01829.1 toxin-antitoxin system HicB family antitoxin [Syntrophomonadaceae bacterium]
MDIKYTLKISPLSEEDGGGYIVEIPELPGCMTDGDTIEEAISKAHYAVDTWIKTASKSGTIIPKPKTYEIEQYSGKFTVRIPKMLHKELAESAEQQGVSLNHLITYYLSKSVGKEMSATLEQPQSQDFIRYLLKDVWTEQSDSSVFMGVSTGPRPNPFLVR